MNDYQKAQLQNLRREGMGYRRIAKAIGLPENTVKSYCRRHPLGQEETAIVQPCLQCGVAVRQNAGRKKKKFCSDKCRMMWWNAHRDRVRHKSTHQAECVHCHKLFAAYGSENRKYCSHACYVADRFGGGRHDA